MAKLRGLHAFTSAAIALCAILVALFACSPVSAQSFNMLAEDLYCGLDNCYVLLDVDRAVTLRRGGVTQNPSLLASFL